MSIERISYSLRLLARLASSVSLLVRASAPISADGSAALLELRLLGCGTPTDGTGEGDAGCSRLCGSRPPSADRLLFRLFARSTLFSLLVMLTIESGRFMASALIKRTDLLYWYVSCIIIVHYYRTRIQYFCKNSLSTRISKGKHAPSCSGLPSRSKRLLDDSRCTLFCTSRYCRSTLLSSAAIFSAWQSAVGWNEPDVVTVAASAGTARCCTSVTPSLIS